MKLYQYSVYDKLSRTFSEPFLAVNDQVAQRRFSAIKQSAPMVAPDLSLVRFGEFYTEENELFGFCNSHGLEVEFLESFDAAEEQK